MSAPIDPKLDPILARRIQEPHSGDEICRVMVALRLAPGPRDLSELEASGLAIGVVAGDIVTGAIQLRSLERLARHPAVLAIEGDRTLEAESGES